MTYINDIDISKLTEQLKDNIKDYLLQYHNIPFLEDELESKLYDIILDCLSETLLEYFNN